MENKKVTKKEYFEMLKGIIANANVENSEELIAFCDAQIASIDNKAAKAKEKAAEKAAEGDALRATVKEAVTTELQTADSIFANIEGIEDLTIAKVRARLTQLVKTEEIVKEKVKTEDGKEKMAYRLA